MSVSYERGTPVPAVDGGLDLAVVGREVVDGVRGRDAFKCSQQCAALQAFLESTPHYRRSSNLEPTDLRYSQSGGVRGQDVFKCGPRAPQGFLEPEVPHAVGARYDDLY